MGEITAIGELTRSAMFGDNDTNKNSSNKKVAVVAVSRDVDARGGLDHYFEQLRSALRSPYHQHRVKAKDLSKRPEHGDPHG